MLVVINGTFGGYEIPDEVMEQINIEDEYENDFAIRTNPIFIDWVKEHIDETDLDVVEIEDNFTDYYIEEYDGLETLLYVVDGKIRFADSVVKF